MKRIMIIIRGWITACHQRKRDKMEARGYDWAAGQLLRGRTVEELLARVNSAALFDDTGVDFDAGARAGIAAWLEMLKQEA